LVDIPVVMNPLLINKFNIIRMRRPTILYMGLICTGLQMGCMKDADKSHALASFRVINALIGGQNIKLNANERDSVLTYNAKVFGLSIVDNETNLRVWPTGQPGKPYYSNKIKVENGIIYSLYIFGLAGSEEALLMKEEIPAWYSDSSMGIRIAHCAPGSGSVNITVKRDPTVPVFSQVSYKEVTNVVKIPLPGTIPAGGTSFEVRDATNSKLLATYTLPTSVNSKYPGISVSLQRFKNITLVIKGSRDTLAGPNAFGVFPVAMAY